MSKQINGNNGMIEFSKDGGVKTTYLRFLADSAPGFLFILIIALLYSAIYQVNNKPVGHEAVNHVEIGILILAFLLATPLGLAINAISWMLLGNCEIRISQCFMKKIADNSFWTRPTCSEYAFDQLCNFYLPCLNCNTATLEEKKERLLCIYKYIKWYEVLLSVYFPAYKTENGYLNGLTQFSRSISLMALILFLSIFVYLVRQYIFCSDGLLHMEKFPLIFSIGFFLISLFSLVIAGFLEFYISIKTLAYVYALFDPLPQLRSVTDIDQLEEIARLIVSEGRKQN